MATEQADKIAVEIVATDKTREGFASASAQVEKHSEAIKSVNDSLREYQKEEKGANRQARFFGAELQGLTGISNNAAQGFAKIGIALGEGGIFGAGMEAAKVGIEALVDGFSRAAQEADKLNQERLDGIKSALDAVAASAQGARDKLSAMLGFDVQGMKAQSALDKARENVEAIRQQAGGRATELADELAAADPYFDDAIKKAKSLADSGLGFAKGSVAILEAQKALKDVNRELEAYRASAELSSQREKTKTDAGTDAATDKENKARRDAFARAHAQEKREVEQHAAQLAAIELKWTKAGLDEAAKARADAAADLAKLSKRDVAARAAIEKGLRRELESIEEKAAAKSAAEKDRLDKQREQAEQRNAERRVATLLDLDAKIANSRRERYEQERQWAAERDQAEEASAQAKLQTQRQIAIGVADAWATAFVSIATKNSSVSKAIIKATIQSAQVAVQAAAASAAAQAAFSQAGIPIIGPALAVGASAAVFGLVSAYLDRIPSARGGFDIPAGINPLTQLHEREMVLPASIAEPLRAQLASGGGGGVTVHLSAIDGPSVQRFVESQGFRRAIAEAQRNGGIR